MKIVKKSSGRNVLRISSKEIESVNRIDKTARLFDIEVSPSFTSPEVIRKTVNVRKDRIPPGMTDAEYLKHRVKREYGDKAELLKSIPKGDVSKKTRPSKKDEQRMRGEKQRKEREKKLNRKLRNEWVANKKKEYGLPDSADESLIDLFEEIKVMEESAKDEKLDNLINQFSKKKQTIKISHKEWESIGKKAGWIKTAYNSEESREWGKMVDDQMKATDYRTRILVGLFEGDKILINRMEEAFGNSPQQVLDERNANLEEENKKRIEENKPIYQWKYLGRGNQDYIDSIKEKWYGSRR